MEFKINSRYDEFHDRLEDANRSGLMWKFEDIKEEIYEEINNLEELKEDIIRYSSWDNPMMDERDDVDFEIAKLGHLIGRIDEYLDKDCIFIRRWYIYNSVNDIKYFKDEDDIIENAKEYVESLDSNYKKEYIKGAHHISIGAEYIREGNSIGMSEFICKTDEDSKFYFSDDMEKVNIQIKGDSIVTIEKLIDILNN